MLKIIIDIAPKCCSKKEVYLLRGRKVRLRGSKVLFQQSHTPAWIWIAITLILWNALIGGWLIPNKFVGIIILSIGFVLTFIIPLYFSDIYVATDREIAVIKRYGKIRKRIEINSSMLFKVTNIREEISFSNISKNKGDIEVYDTKNNLLLVLKGIKNPAKVIKLLKEVSANLPKS